ncbi:DUF1254 domain-containing protein [Leifsonia sp. NPDC056665]|uniref:DUF1254 domain-containing protein n=1 Tax=Leifsonia sp. NPDC056665 TaxID=3345901 RepID=UPI0036B8ADE4
MPITVNIDNFPRAETDAMIAGLLPYTGGLGTFHHNRELEPFDRQPVIRQNRDTLYSVAVVDVAEGATLTVPDAADRYLSVMVINQDHYINRVFHEAGTYELTTAEFDTDYVVVAVRILFEPGNAADLAEVHRLQDGLSIRAGAQRPVTNPDYDLTSHRDVRDALLTLGRTMGGLTSCFGRRGDVDPVRHLVGTAVGWGGLPDDEAAYINVEPRLPLGRYTLTLDDVPASAFWSVSVYNAEGYFEPDESGVANVNSVFAVREPSGRTVIHLGDWGDDVPNRIALPKDWNYMIRLYQPRLDSLRTWAPPAVVPA